MEKVACWNCKYWFSIRDNGCAPGSNYVSIHSEGKCKRYPHIEQKKGDDICGEHDCDDSEPMDSEE